MKQFFLALLVIAGLVWAAPGQAFAAKATNFTGEGYVYSMPAGNIKPLPKGFLTKDEYVDLAVYASTGWADLAGATINTVHKSNSRIVSPDGSFIGHGSGKITITTASGRVLTGNFNFDIAGQLDLNTDELLALNDNGKFNANDKNGKISGSFQLLYSVADSINVATFVGTIH